MVSKEAQAFLSMKIRKNIQEGRPMGQAIAIGLSQTKKRGFKI